MTRKEYLKEAGIELKDLKFERSYVSGYTVSFFFGDYNGFEIVDRSDGRDFIKTKNEYLEQEVTDEYLNIVTHLKDTINDFKEANILEHRADEPVINKKNINKLNL